MTILREQKETLDRVKYKVHQNHLFTPNVIKKTKTLVEVLFFVSMAIGKHKEKFL